MERVGHLELEFSGYFIDMPVEMRFVKNWRFWKNMVRPQYPLMRYNYFEDLTMFTSVYQRLFLTSSNAIKRVLNVIKNTIVKCQDNVIRRASIEIVRDRLQAQADWVIKDMTAQINSTPGRVSMQLLSRKYYCTQKQKYKFHW